jgi:hypothetical protein
MNKKQGRKEEEPKGRAYMNIHNNNNNIRLVCFVLRSLSQDASSSLHLHMTKELDLAND